MQPFVNAAQITQRTGLSAPTVNNSLEVLEREGIVHEVTGKRRGRVYAYTSLLDILDEGTNTAPSA